eukprot:GGOE01036398.1.p1 GENE.GGOE01036398.1~~GGOE01036398.1.p1  ORF type:complete len:278 (+),score=82.33 GGOE01036398.1:27-836(+)
MAAVAYTALAQRLGKGRTLVFGWSCIPCPMLAGLMAREQLDGVVIDMQHGAYSLDNAVQAVSAVMLAGKPAIVRVPVGEYSLASRMLDFGASAIIAPMVNSAEDAHRFVSFVKFPPVGERSWGPDLVKSLSGLESAEYLQQANGLTKAFAMIETREALAALDAILAVEGLDGVFVGPNDLSIALSHGAFANPSHADVEAALELILARCRAAGKSVGIYANNGDRANVLLQRGFDFITLGCDYAQMRLGIRSMLDQAGVASKSTEGAGGY